MTHKDKKESILPRPCNGPLYADWDAIDYVMKIKEEVEEVVEASRLYNLNRDNDSYLHFGRELVDVITACISTLETLGFKAADREKMYQEVNESNAKRDDGRRFANEELPTPTPAFKDRKKSETVKDDKVNHPHHYDLPGGGQAIDVIDDMLDDTETEGYYKGNIIKYIARYKGKGGTESLKKARWYLDKLIALREVQEKIDAE